MLGVLVYCMVLLSSDVNGDTHICKPCPPSWRVFDHSCYLYVDQELTFDAAEAFCNTLSHGLRESHLISIASEVENDFAAMYATSIGGSTLHSMWMGMDDEANEGEFRWKDNSGYEYRNWAPDEPNNGGGNQDCTQLLFYPGWGYDTYGLWDDVECIMEYAFMCKMPGRLKL